MFTIKQLLFGIGLSILGNAVMVTAANAGVAGYTDDYASVYMHGSNFVKAISARNYVVKGFARREGLAGGISIPPGMSLLNTNTSSDEHIFDRGNAVITIGDIADYLTSSIDRSLAELDLSISANRPQCVIGRRNETCPNPQTSRSWETLDDLLNQSEQFIEQVNQIKPENSTW